MKKLTSSPTPLTLHHYRNLLEAEGIEAEIKNEHFGSAFGGMPLAESTLWVVNDLDFDRAKQLIDGTAFDESPKDAWKCRMCGEENEGQFAACWKCGSAIA
mgnify:CR=1 FL=1|jgi:hypothetical protein